MEPVHPASRSTSLAEVASAHVQSLYFHVPFCARKCDYCAFYSEPSHAELSDRYTAALIREIELVADGLRPNTLFFGGGTPTVLNLRQWSRVFETLRRCLRTLPEEWTVECNPATLSLDKAKLLRDGGVNRVSLGVQSLDDHLLDRLGRVHSRAMVFRSFDLLRRAGFDNVNLDLMFAIPGQSLDAWRATLEEALAFESEHLSCYEVIYEEDTPLFEQLQAGAFDVDEDLACAMYVELQETADARGLQQYEIANFARHRGSDAAPLPSLACQHNVNYWRGGSFHGLGPSACSFVHQVRTRNRANTRLYCDQIDRGERPVDSRDQLSPLRRAGEIAAFGLRMNIGWPFDQFKQATGFDLRDDWQDSMAETVARDWAVQDAHGFRLTPLGLRFADAAAELFLREDPQPST